MAQYEEEIPEELEEQLEELQEELPEDAEAIGALEVKVIQTDVDDFAEVLQEKFQEAREFLRDHEQHWLEA